MRYLITGEHGFIAQNLRTTLENRGHEVVNVSDPHLKRTSKGEVCVHGNTPDVWSPLIKGNQVDVVVHNAAVVGTDVVGLNPEEATLTNVLGTRTVVQACEEAKVPVCFLGTTVVYETDLYQDVWIDETSRVRPRTYYGILKATGDAIVKQARVPATIVRPLFAYGGPGDMNSLIVKSIFGSVSGRSNVDVFLDPFKVKDYLHVDDFCEAVAVTCERDLWGRDFIVSNQDPRTTHDVVDVISETCGTDVRQILRWHPKTDYLGNHRLSSKSFRNASGWHPKISLEDGIKRTFEEVTASLSGERKIVDPMIHVDEATRRNVDLTKFY